MERRLRLHALVSGRVQGVFYRANTESTATRIGSIDGWVKNLKDGRVEVLAEGPESNLKQLVEFLHIGPPKAKVTNVELEWSDPSGGLERFSVRK